MGYLQPIEYQGYGLSPDTPGDWISMASALMENYCRRASLAITQYTERLRVSAGSQSVQLTYLPLVTLPPAALPLITVQARYAMPRRGERMYEFEDLWKTFSLPGSWITLDPNEVDWTPNGGLTFPLTIYGLPFNEVTVMYTAELNMIPDAVKSACALIVKNAQSTSGLNIKSSRIDLLQVQYFSDQLVDNTVKTLLRPWVANRLG